MKILIKIFAFCIDNHDIKMLTFSQFISWNKKLIFFWYKKNNNDNDNIIIFLLTNINNI